MNDDWEVLYRWEWFHRDAWRGEFRRFKRGPRGGSCAAVRRIVDELGGGPVLDCSCGLGLKTVVLKEMGLDVVGSDGCGFAVAKARELARLEGLDIEFFCSTWAELPEKTSRRFAGVFNDALSWTTSREELGASLRGVREVLRPGGVLVFFGAHEGSPGGPEATARVLDELWTREPRFSVRWQDEHDAVRCAHLVVRERGEDCLDEHHLFLVEEGGHLRLESATIRQPACWHWPILVEMFAEAGFTSLRTRNFPGLANDGGDIRLNVATR